MAWVEASFAQQAKFLQKNSCASTQIWTILALQKFCDIRNLVRTPLPMQNPSTDRYTTSPSTNTYSASVPISIYRELGAELQAAKVMLDSLNAKNQQLAKQNQQLRQEVEKVVQSAQYLQQVVDSFEENRVEKPSVVSSEPRLAASVPRIDFPPLPNDDPPAYTEAFVFEQNESRPSRASSDGFSDINGWVLVVAILAIVLTAFGAGFLVVRPLLENNR